MKQRRWIQILITAPTSFQELLTGQLAAIGFEGFVQEDSSVTCYVEEAKWSKKFEQSVENILSRFQQEFPAFQPRYRKKIIREQNWNAQWERKAGIVEATDRIIIKPTWKKLRAKDKGKVVIHIDPKMSFGTGHHETTRLTLTLLEEYIKPKARVLDFGSGTGVLAIAAMKLGASSVAAIDIDEWAIENAKENVKKNNAAKHIKLTLGGVERIPKQQFDMILGNIDFPTISATFSQLLHHLKDEGVMILSGLLTSDLQPLMDMLSNSGAVPLELVTENEWVALALVKAIATDDN